MALDRVPFQPTRLEEDREERDQVNVGLSPQHRASVDRLKQAFDLKSDSKAIRILLEAGENAIFGTLSAKTLRYLSVKDRARLSDYERLEEPK